MAEEKNEIDAIFAPIEVLLRPTYESASEETWQVNGHVSPIDPDDLRAALDAARLVAARLVAAPDSARTASPGRG